MRLVFGDKVVAAVILIVALSGLFLSGRLFAGQAAREVVIELDGREYARYSLGKEKKWIEVRSEYGYNKIEIGENYVRVAEADCPDKLDVRAGEIRSAGQMIVCLPNRLVVRLVGPAKGVDIVTY